MTLQDRHTRYRKFFPFQLDLNKPDEAEIANQIDELKRKRSFSRTIRDGIRLICDLRNGRVAVLQELFPWVLEQPIAEPQVPYSPPPSDVFVEYLQRIEQLFEKNKSLVIDQGGQPRLTEPKDLIEIKTAPSVAGEKPHYNMLINSALQFTGSCDYLPDEIIEYGLRTGKIRPDMVKPRQNPPPQKGNPRKLVGSNIQFDTPQFDDLDVEL